MLSLSKSVTAFCKENPKTTSSKVYDSLREKAPKAIAENCYCAIFWYVLQDLCARVGNQNAAWLSNGMFNVGFYISSFGSAFFASIVISIVSAIMNAIVADN